MRVYLAAKFQAGPVMREWRDMLTGNGIEVTSRWFNGTHEPHDRGHEDAQRDGFAREDLEDIDKADVLVAWNPADHHGTGSGGRHVEVGYAIGTHKPVVVVGARENVFHYLRGQVIHVERRDDLVDVLLALDDLARP